MFVRLFIDENLDRSIPISKQPKEKVSAILESCRRQFPDLQLRARKRIRTYLKSCRRTKKIQSLKKPDKSCDSESNQPSTSGLFPFDTVVGSAAILKSGEGCLRLSRESLNSPAYHLNSAMAEGILAEALDNEMNYVKQTSASIVTADQLESVQV
jgi:hypothetical protein